MLSADHLNIDGPPFPVCKKIQVDGSPFPRKCVRKFRSILGEVTRRCVWGGGGEEREWASVNVCKCGYECEYGGVSKYVRWECA